MIRFSVPGGQCAVSKNGHLLYSRGFGYVDAQNPGQGHPPVVEPNALFRIASSSKPITAVAIMALIQTGALKLDDRAFDILHDFTPPPGQKPDPRLHTITVRQLLEHSSGFVNDPFDVQFDGLRIAADVFGQPRPATNVDCVRYMMGRPLGFAPGTSYSYSNAGYNALGRIIEHITKLPYGEAVNELVLTPLRIHGMALMTRTSPSHRLPNEVFYVDGAQYLDGYPIYEDDPEVRRYSYGGYDGTAIDAHGGWIANAADLCHFLNGVGGKSGKQILSRETVKIMLARPNNPFWKGKDHYYALGWNVTPGVVTLSHAGAITFGTASVVIRIPGEITMAAVFNHLDADIGAMVGGLGDGLRQVANGITMWPSHDIGPAA